MKKYLYLILFFLVCVPAIAGTINSYTLKSPPDDADTIVIYDSDDGSTKKIEVGDISGSGSSSGFTDGGTNVYATTTSDNVAIGTTTPTQKLTVVGTVDATAFTGNGSGLTGIAGINWSSYPDLTALTSAQEFLVNNAGTSSSINWEVFQTQLPSSGGWTDDGTVVRPTTTTDNVGIGTTTATEKLRVVGNISSSGNITGANLSGTNTGDQTLAWVDGGSNVYLTTSTDSVGVGTTAPLGRLTIKGQNIHYLGCTDTISTAVSDASAGDEIVLGACTYSLSSAVSITKSLKIVGQGPKSTILSLDTESGAFSISGSGVTDVLISNMSIIGSDTGTAIAITDGNGSADDPDNIFVKNVNIVLECDDGCDGVRFSNSSGFVEDSYINITNTNGGSSSTQVRGIYTLTNGASGSGATTGSEANEDHTLVVRNTTVIVGDNSGTWAGGRMRGFFNWMNSADTTQYNSTSYIYNSQFFASVLSPGGGDYGTEAVSSQGPLAAYSAGVTGLLSSYFYNSYADGGPRNPSVSTGARDIRCDDYAECYLINTALRRQDIQNQNSAVIYRRGVINASGLYSLHQESASLLTSGAAGVYAVGQNAGNETQAGVRTGLTGGVNRLEGGDGSSATGTDAAKTGGSGGSNTIIGGDGGDQTSAAPSNTGGAGGAVSIAGGTGGNASVGTTNTGGRGGHIYIRGGIPGTGTDANGTEGNIFLGVDSSGNRYGNIGIGTLTTPGSKLSVFGGVTLGNNAYATTAVPTGTLAVSGNVGVGTFAPSSSIEIVKSGSTNPFMVSSTATGDGDYMIVSSNGTVGIGTVSPINTRLALNDSTYQLRLDNPDAGGGFWYISQTDDAHGAGGGKLAFIADSATSSSAKVVFTNAGNVGIGTILPISTLEVNGLIVPDKVTADPCTASQEGAIFYNNTSNYWCGCNGTDDVKLTDNTTACF